VVKFDKKWGVYLVCRFPGVVTLRVSFPFDEVLESF